MERTMEGSILKAYLELPANLKASCRLCGNFSFTVVKLFNEEGVCGDLANKINLYLPAKVHSGDGLPDQCCWQCTSTVFSWHNLYMTCQATEKKLMVFKKVPLPLVLPVVQVMPFVLEHHLQNLGNFEEVSTQQEEVPQIQEITENLGNFEEVSTQEEEEVALVQETTESHEEVVQEEPFVGKSPERILVESIEEFYDEEQVLCCICNKVFNTQRSCDIHVRKVHENYSGRPKVPCPICGALREKTRMELHIRRMHTQDKPFSCKTCGRTFKMASDLKNHMRNHSDLKLFKCKLCPRAFNLKESLKYHWYAHLKNKPIFCKLCDKQFVRLYSLKVHIEKLHDLTQEQYKDLSVEEVKEIKAVAASKRLEKAQSKKGEDVFLVTPEQSPHVLVESMEQLYGEKQVSCDICNKVFPSELSCRLHVVKVHETPSKSERIPCQICGEPRKKSSMKTHIARKHSNEKPFACKVCKRTFKLESDLGRHMRIHSNLRPFKCKLCPKAFKVHNSLKYHLLSHLKTKSISCKLCGASFHTEYNLKRHIYETHELTEQQYNNVPEELIQDLDKYATNSPEERTCKECNITFKLKKMLCEHNREVHSIDTTPFLCEICGKGFKFTHTLASHKNRHYTHQAGHRKQRKYLDCEVCNKRFYRPAKFVLHCRTAHQVIE